MFVEDVTRYIKEHEQDIILVYPPDLCTTRSIVLGHSTLYIAWNSLRCHNGKKQNQDRLLLFYDHHARCILSGVFDGHGKEGHLIATFFRNTFLSTFIHQAQENKNIENAFRIAEQKLEENQDINIKQSGTTAMITLLSASMEGIPSFHSLNVGDSECFMSIRSKYGTRNNPVNTIHSLHLPDERLRIEQAGGYIRDSKLVPYVPSILRIFTDPSCTRGGFTMSRSIGDTLIHRYGVISTPTIDHVDFSHQQDCTIRIFLGSDGFLSYPPKDALMQFFTDNYILQKSLDEALKYAQEYLLKQTQNKYADDTSGIVYSFQL